MGQRSEIAWLQERCQNENTEPECSVFVGKQAGSLDVTPFVWQLCEKRWRDSLPMNLKQR